MTRFGDLRILPLVLTEIREQELEPEFPRTLDQLVLSPTEFEMLRDELKRMGMPRHWFNGETLIVNHRRSKCRILKGPE